MGERDDRRQRSRRTGGRRRTHLVPALVAFAISAIACGIVHLTVPAGTVIEVPFLTDTDGTQGAAATAQAPDRETDAAADGDAVRTEQVRTLAPTGDIPEPEAADGQAAEAPEEQEAAAAPEIASTRYELEGDARDAVAADKYAFAALTQEIAAFEERGLTVAFVLHDVEGGGELTYDADEELYPASSIKGPFTTCIYQELVEKGLADLAVVEPVARVTILESSDEGYRTLHELFGEQAFVTWLADAGVGPGSYGTLEQMVAWNYPHVSARQLALMWRHVFEYLSTTDTEASRQLASLFDAREASSVRMAVDEGVRTWSKMGWFESVSDFRSEPATVEAGTVFAESGTYVFAVMTTAPAELDSLVPLLAALDAAHDAMA